MLKGCSLLKGFYFVSVVSAGGRSSRDSRDVWPEQLSSAFPKLCDGRATDWKPRGYESQILELARGRREDEADRAKEVRNQFRKVVLFSSCCIPHFVSPPDSGQAEETVCISSHSFCP